jgi:hypothetical protein
LEDTLLSYNLRSILLKSNVLDIQQRKSIDVTSKYRAIPDEEQFRVGFIQEIIEVLNNNLEVPGFTDEEFGDLLQHLCVS